MVLNREVLDMYKAFNRDPRLANSEKKLQGKLKVSEQNRE